MTDIVDTTTSRSSFLRGLTVDRVDLVPAGANPDAHITLFKQRGPASPENQEVTMSDKPETPAEEATVAKADLDAAQTELAELRKQLDEAKAAETEATELRKQLEVTQEDIAKIRAEQREQEFIAKAKEFENLGPVTDIGKLMQAADEHFDDAQKQTLTRLLSGASAQVEKGALFDTFTRPADETADTGWQDRLEKKASELVAAGTVATVELAKQKVMHDDPDIRREYTASVRGR
jgi:hypothetical protein